MTSKQSNRVLVVDSEPLILRVYATQLSRFYAINTASSAQEALQFLHDRGPYAVIVSDMMLPDSDGAEFFGKVRWTYPDTVRVLLTAELKTEEVGRVVNEGGIFQYLNKPCTSDRLAKSIEISIERYHRNLVEKQFMTGTLNAAIQIQLDTLEMMNPEALEKSRRVEKVVRYLVDHLSPPNGWMINLAARLCLIGEAIPEAYRKGKSSAEVGAKLLGRLSQLREIVDYIRKQRNRPMTALDPNAGRILPLALRYCDFLEQGLDPVLALGKMSEDVVSGEEEIVEKLAAFVYGELGIPGEKRTVVPPIIASTPTDSAVLTN